MNALKAAKKVAGKTKLIGVTILTSLDNRALKQIGFTIGVIVLSAKMAKADGKVTKSEIKAYKEKINVPDNEIKNVARLWDQAKKTTDGFEVYAKQISNLLEKNSSVLEELLNLLVIIAEADGKITNLEKIYLKEAEIKSKYLRLFDEKNKFIGILKNINGLVSPKRLSLIHI